MFNFQCSILKSTDEFPSLLINLYTQQLHTLSMSTSTKYLQFGLATLLLLVIWVIFLALLYSGSNELGYALSLYIFSTIFGYLLLPLAVIILMIRLLENPSLRQTFVYNIAGTGNMLLGATYCGAYLLLGMDHLHWDFLINLFVGTVIVIDILLA
jgi:hypothetical protein